MGGWVGGREGRVGVWEVGISFVALKNTKFLISWFFKDIESLPNPEVQELSRRMSNIYRHAFFTTILIFEVSILIC